MVFQYRVMRFRLTLFVVIWVAAMSLAQGEVPDPSDPIAGRDHWAFQPLKASVSKSRADWSRTAIDDFIMAGLLKAELGPVSDAESRALLRRVTFQLIGLPPTPQQVRDYLEDTRPDAFERVVDQLLDSPRFGERWGRHWLDLARYADSNGLDESFLFREAWRYRNWVIDAVNQNLPFDQFVLN